MEEAQSTEGIWENATAYPKKVVFEIDKPVVITFPNDFVKPKEMPGSNGMKPFCIFDVLSGDKQEKSVIMTSSITMLRNFKTNMPLAGKSLTITKKNVGGKNFFYVEDAEKFKARMDATPEPKQVDTQEAGIKEDSTM